MTAILIGWPRTPLPASNPSSQAPTVHQSRYRSSTIGPRVIPEIIAGDPFNICAYEQWMEDANCLDVDPEVFYPAKGAQRKCAAAKRICHACSVEAQCLAYALRIHEAWGIWGGKTATERRKTEHA